VIGGQERNEAGELTVAVLCNESINNHEHIVQKEE